MEKQLEFFLNQDSSNEKQEKGLKFQYMVHRQKIGVSNIPLDLLYNEKVDMIKRFEGQTSKDARDPAPIKLALMENFVKNEEELTLINVKCEEYVINKNQIIPSESLGTKMYLSEPERKELQKKLEKASASSSFVNKNFETFAKNILGVRGAKKSKKVLKRRETTKELETKRLYNLQLKNDNDDFEQLTGTEASIDI